MVASNSFQIFMLSFTPRDATRHAAALQCSLNDGAATKSVALEGIGYVPEVEIVEGEELWFKPTSIGMASVRAMHVRNKSRIPLRFRWEIPAKFANLLAVRDDASLLSGMESTLVRWRFSPQSDGPVKLWAVCEVYSGGDGDEPERVFQKLAVHFHGQGKNNSLVRFEPLQVDFGTALVGSSSTRELTLVNGSNSKLRYELVVRRVDGGNGDGEGGPELAPLIECTPPIDELQARSSTTVKVKFTPRGVGEFKFEVLWDTASDRRLKAVQAHHELTKAELCMANAHFHHKPDMNIITHHLKAAACVELPPQPSSPRSMISFRCVLLRFDSHTLAPSPSPPLHCAQVHDGRTRPYQALPVPRHGQRRRPLLSRVPQRRAACAHSEDCSL